MTKEITLEGAPDLRRIYATAALRRGKAGGTLPDVRYSRAGIRVGVDDLIAYSHVCRFPVADPLSTEQVAAVAGGPVWRLGEGTGRSYAVVSGDWNPIHVHALTARPLGFPSAIAHGMYSYPRVLASLGPRLPEAGLTSHVWFRKPVRLPSTVRLRTAFESSRTLSVIENAKSEIEHAVVENTW